MTVMGKIGIGVATAVLSAAAVAMLGLGGEGNTTLNINGGNTGGYQATQSYSGLCVTTMGSCQVQPLPRGSSCGCYNAYGQAFYGSVQ